jgi:hypothetical protein
VKRETIVGERREHPRLTQSFQGTWAGTGPCRVSDVSLGGCFVNSLVSPLKGDETTILVEIGDITFTMKGRVAYVDPGIGFALQFGEIGPSARRDLQQLLRALSTEADPA